jgi:hypothetical protein
LRGAAEVEATLERCCAEVEATLRGAEVEADVEVQKPKMKQLVSTFVAVLSAVVAFSAAIEAPLLFRAENRRWWEPESEPSRN